MTITAPNPGSIAIAVIDRVDTGDLSGTTPVILTDMVSDNGTYIEELTGESTAFIDRYTPALIHITIADVISREASIGIDADVSLADFSIKKGSASKQQVEAIKYHISKAQKLLKNRIRAPVTWSRVYTV